MHLKTFDTTCFAPIDMQTHEVKQFNWLYQVIQEKWRAREVGLRYYHAPLPIKLQLYCQFM